jgi:hypothetical protein
VSNNPEKTTQLLTMIYCCLPTIGPLAPMQAVSMKNTNNNACSLCIVQLQFIIPNHYNKTDIVVAGTREHSCRWGDITITAYIMPLCYISSPALHPSMSTVSTSRIAKER